MLLNINMNKWLSRSMSIILIATGLCINAAQAETNGIWYSSGNSDYLMVMEDATGTTIELEVAADLSSANIWVGSESSGNVSLNNFATNTDSLTENIAGDSLSGRMLRGGASSSYFARLLYKHVGGAYDGVWQRENVSREYFAYLTVDVAGISTTVVIDLVVNNDMTYTFDIFAGSMTSKTYKGGSLKHSGKTLTLVFNGSTANGTYTTGSNPPETFSAFRILGIVD
ncbi:conserved exported hypothetical protein [Gammaproteobacteria bacterium]